MIAGIRAVTEALAPGAGGAPERLLLANKGSRALDALEQRARARGVPVERVSTSELGRVSRGLRHQGAIALAAPYPYVDLEDLLSAADAPLLVALDSITDPHNLGAIVRSSVAFGVDGLVLPKRRAVGVTPAVTRVSTGATAHARIAQVTNLSRALTSLAKAGLSIVGLAGEGEITLDALPDAPRGRVLVVGSEGKGLGRLVRERCDLLARIDLPGPVASLNASVAAAIAIRECSRSRARQSSASRSTP
ncbi:MAG: 23S rRNA (guanosine(2251)-2'-O)-methyltransferase RlmB [Deltaproteobacteria bacterium]|nr:23S rRNA (guanosine(2251)-2'-O)-methyltransferase RlmB [Deltaproteobacteria bacterium]